MSNVSTPGSLCSCVTTSSMSSEACGVAGSRFRWPNAFRCSFPRIQIDRVSGWSLAAGDRVLSGSVAEVERTLSSLGVARRRDPTDGEIAHLATVMAVSGEGRVIRRLDGGWGGAGELVAALPRLSGEVTRR